MEQWQHEEKAKRMITAGRPASEIAKATDLDITWIKLKMQEMKKNAL